MKESLPENVIGKHDRLRKYRGKTRLNVSSTASRYACLPGFG